MAVTAPARSQNPAGLYQRTGAIARCANDAPAVDVTPVAARGTFPESLNHEHGGCQRVLETALICAQQPVPVRELRVLFNDALGSDTLRCCCRNCSPSWAQRGVELVQVATGWRFPESPRNAEYLDRLHPEKPPRAHATMETLAIMPTGNRSRVGISKTFAV